MAIVILVCLAACGIDLDPDPTTCPTSLALDRATLAVPLGHQAQIGVVGGDSDCFVSWSAWPDSLVDVKYASVATTVTARRVGQSIVTGARPNRATATCVVNVLPNDFVAVNILADTLILVGLGNTGSSTIRATLSDISEVLVIPPVAMTWTISDPEIAVVTSVHDTAGFRALDYGTAEVTVTYAGPGTATALVDRMILRVVEATESARDPGPFSYDVIDSLARKR